MQWLAGDEKRREALLDAVARLVRDEGVHWLRAREGRRRLGRVALEGGGSVFAKHYLMPTRHAAREWWKRRLFLTTAEREWRTLVRLRATGIPVPEPFARVRLANGESVLLTAWIDGAPLGDALPAAPAPRRRLLGEAGALVRRLHDAGWAHRDLHRENLFVGEAGIYLIDLQAARRLAGPGARRRDLGRLDFSMRRVLSLPDRLRLRAAAMGLSRPFDARARAALREVGAASLARGRIHAASRARRSLREGRLYRRIEIDDLRGLISREADEAALRQAVTGAAGGAPRIEVRRHAEAPGALWRGSVARRAFAVAHALMASDVACAQPIAFLERRAWRGESLLALVRPSPDPEPGATPAMLAALREQLREAGFDGELGAPDVVVREGRPVVSALEKLRFRGRSAGA